MVSNMNHGVMMAFTQIEHAQSRMNWVRRWIVAVIFYEFGHMIRRIRWHWWKIDHQPYQLQPYRHWIDSQSVRMASPERNTSAFVQSNSGDARASDVLPGCPHTVRRVSKSSRILCKRLTAMYNHQNNRKPTTENRRNKKVYVYQRFVVDLWLADLCLRTSLKRCASSASVQPRNQTSI